MRPVVKWDPQHGEGIREEYPNYRDAKPHLCRNLGTMCSYCEKAYTDGRDLHVEHVQPKGYKDAEENALYAHLETAWSNFLLACPTCNGPDNKGDKNVVLGHCHLPHLNNTFLSLRYRPGGVVEVNPVLSGLSAENADNLLRLVGLDKSPRTSSPQDKRCLVRSEKWNLAQRYLDKYRRGRADVETIIDLAKGHGCWSIWFTVFQGCDEVREALIEQFPGTAARCFDASRHYEPVNRNPDNPNDPI